MTKKHPKPPAPKIGPGVPREIAEDLIEVLSEPEPKK